MASWRGSGKIMRASVTALCVALVGLSGAAEAQAAIRRQTHIPAQNLGPALQSLAKEHSFQLVYVSEEVDVLQTQGAVGEFTPEEALTRLLTGTGLTFKYLDEHTVTILPAAPAKPASPPSRERTSRTSKPWTVKNVRLAS